MNAPFTPRGSLRDPFSAFLTDLDSEDVARAAALSFGWTAERISNGGVKSAVQSLAVAPSPAILLVDLSDSPDAMEDINALAEVCEPGTMVIACGQINDVRFYRELTASGIHDYLVKPFTIDQLREAIEAAQSVAIGMRASEAANEAPHLMTAVVGVRGGVGASTLAVSIAWLLSQRQRSTALLDLDVHFGTGALGLDLEPGRGLLDAIENPGRIDGLFIERALIRANDHLGVLSAEAPMTQPLTGDGSAFLQLEGELRGAMACSVVDLPRHVLVQHPDLVQEASVVVVVTELTLAATRDTIRVLSWLKANASGMRVILVGNKVPPASVEEVSRKEFESSIERKLDLVFPYDPKLAAQAAKLGKPLAEVAKGTKLAPCFAQLADILLDEQGGGAAKGAKSLLGRLSDLRSLLPHKAA